MRPSTVARCSPAHSALRAAPERDSSSAFADEKSPGGETGARAPGGHPSWCRLPLRAARRHLPPMNDKKNRNEGEGSKTADKKYRDAATDFANRTDTVKAGLDAERDVEQRKGEFDRAEQQGRGHSKGDLPNDLSGNDFDKR